MRAPPDFLRVLLALYPPAHRRAYGEEMWDAVAFRVGRTRGAARVWAVAQAAGDLLWSAARTWMTTGTRRVADMGGGWGLDLRFVLRSVARSPGYVATVVLVLAGAVAVNATVYSFVRGTLLHQPSYQDPGRVMVVWGSNTVDGQLRDVISGPNYIDMARRSQSLSAMAAFHFSATYLTEDGPPEMHSVLETSVDFLDVLGVAPALGRGFDERDRTSSGPADIMVSWGFWQSRLGGDPEVVGRALEFKEEPLTVVGVLPEDFEFVAPFDVVTPLRDDVLEAGSRYGIHYNAVGRLAPGATAPQATRELSDIMRSLADEYPGYRNWSALVEPLHQVTVSAVRPVIWALTAVVGLVLLIALVNLATLFRIRAVARGEELSVRVALGAGWARVARVLFLEAGGLAAVGALTGVAVTPFLLDRVRSLLPPSIPIPESAVRVSALRAVLDPEVAAVAVGAAVVGALLLTAPGLISVVRRRGGPRSSRVHRGVRGTRVLVGAELTLATVLCLGAGLTVRSASHLLATDVGLDDQELLVGWVGDVWDRDATGRVAYLREIVDEIQRIPGVRSAAVTDYPDFMAEDDYEGVTFLDRSLQPLESQREEWRRVSEGLFETTGMRILAGRSFGADDFQGTPRVAVVNQAFARKHYPAGDAVGRYLSLGNEQYQELEIVGVVADLRSLGPAAPPPAMLYVPNQGDPRGTLGLYVRVSGDPSRYVDAVRDAIWSVDPSQPVAELGPMSSVVGAWVAIPRTTRDLLSGLAALSLLLAALGVFGVVAFAVRSRRSELGVRLALGASPQRLRKDVATVVLPVAVLGITLGLVVGVLGARAARVLLYSVSPLDPASLVGAVAAMAGAAFLATWLPARRVSRIDPSEAMRAD